ncbi:MAG: type II secretion system F family protein [Candidatus Omnitrophica bacterium]|jgi:type IV pilus assembly protein PilC|nr:type II secretion system F family protein [Candidatus Omnitrophota bacterium]
MPKYIYTAKSNPGELMQSVIDVESEQAAINKLLEMGYFPVSVKPENSYLDKQKSYFKKVSRKDLVIFTRQLSSLIESGVNILDSLNIVTNQTSNKYFKAVLTDVSVKIKDGKSLSESLNLYDNIFSNLYTSIIHSGEASGNLEKVIKSLAEFFEKDEEFRASLRASLTYPLFIAVVGVLTVSVLMGFVIPKLVTMFEDLGQALPIPTKILINVSVFFTHYWWIIFAVIFLVIFSLQRAVKTNQGKLFIDRFKLKIPMAGEIVLKSEIARLSRTLSLLISSGLAVVSALNVTIAIIGNQILKNELEKFKKQITDGLSFSKCLNGSKLFPSFVTNIVAVGEEGGSLEKSLMRVADEYERDVDRSLKAISRLIEPVIILVMGVVVGFIVLAMLLPIFQINLTAR